MILVVVEHANGNVSKSSWEMITVARELGREASVTALVLGSNIAPVAAEIARGVDQVLVADLPALAQYDSELWSAAVAQIATEGEASVEAPTEPVAVGGGEQGQAASRGGEPPGDLLGIRLGSAGGVAKPSFSFTVTRIALSPEEEQKLGAQLGNILGYIEKLNQADVAGVEPLSITVIL